MATKYTPEFKREAVRMMTELGLSVPNVATKLGVSENQLYTWRKQARLEGEAAFPGSGRLTPIEDENRRLKAIYYQHLRNHYIVGDIDLVRTYGLREQIMDQPTGHEWASKISTASSWAMRDASND